MRRTSWLWILVLQACFMPVDALDAGAGGGSAAGGSAAGGSAAGGSAAGGSAAGGSAAGGSAAGGSAAGGSAAGGSAAGGSAAGGSAAGGSAAGGSTGGGQGGGNPQRTCADVESAYAQALNVARRCAPLLPVIQCTHRRPELLGCPGCTTAVQLVATLDQHAAEFRALNCPMTSCPFVCNMGTGGACMPDSGGTMGTCQNQP
ncbi:MAG: hypothetical protein JNJ54_19475 [Myxococcaceae bacterium]|nr:hypothetical protein [Myxococcaceae bacterium]